MKRRAIFWMHHRAEANLFDKYARAVHWLNDDKFADGGQLIPVAWKEQAHPEITRCAVDPIDRSRKLTTMFKRGDMDYQSSLAWAQVHLLIIGAFLKNQNYDEYLILESDVFLNCRLEQFFRPPTAEATVVNPMTVEESKDWEWTKLYRQCNPNHSKMKEWLCGVGPCCLQFWQRNALEKVAREIYHEPAYDNMLCELAIGTALRKLGIQDEQWGLVEPGESVLKYFQPTPHLLGDFDPKRETPLWFHPKK